MRWDQCSSGPVINRPPPAPKCCLCQHVKASGNVDHEGLIGGPSLQLPPGCHPLALPSTWASYSPPSVRSSDMIVGRFYSEHDPKHFSDLGPGNREREVVTASLRNSQHQHKNPN